MRSLLYVSNLFGFSIEVYFILLFIGIPVYFIWRKIYRKSIKSASKRRLAIWISTIFTTPMIYGGLVFLLCFIMGYYPDRNFDKESWLKNEDQRYEYSKDIINSKMLLRKSKSQIRGLLGNAGNPDSSDFWQYKLGFKPELGNIDNDWLDIQFKNGKVIEVDQHQE